MRGQQGDALGGEAMEAQTPKIRVLIADDHPLMILGVRRALERGADIEVVGEAHSGPEVFKLIERRQPGMVLLDLRMPGVSGADCIERIRSTWPEVKVVVLSACDDRPSIDSALSAGASAYVVKSVQAADIASVLRQAASGSVFHATSRPTASVDTEGERPLPLLTDRERAILESVAQGLTTAAISQNLWVSEHTVKFHLTNIYRKLGVVNRAAAVRYAVENELVAA
jgi:DNA-binding NarL/FixJ family response regulator